LLREGFVAISALVMFLCFVCAIASGILAIVWGVKMLRRRQAGVPLNRPWGTPWGVLFRPHELTSEGNYYRRRTLWACAGWVVFQIIGMALGLVAGLVK
jgi:hypothetical protein